MQRLRSFSRFALALSLWVLCGMALTVGVSWGSHWVPVGWSMTAPISVRINPDADMQFAWPPEVTLDWAYATKWRMRSRCFWADEVRASIFDNDWNGISDLLERPQSVYSIVDRQSGVPFRGLRSWVIEGRKRGVAPSWTRTYGNWTIDRNLAHVVSLPLIPLWPGFALNTIFYAAIAWALWQIPLALRRRHRRVAHRCTRCGYPLAGLPPTAPCPECATPQPPA